MTFLWLWLYSLKTPITVLCGLAIAGCFVNFLSARSSGRGGASLWGTLHIAIGLGLFWTAVYAIPSPTYDIKTVVKEVPKPYPVVKKYIAQKLVLTRTVTVSNNQDTQFNWCMNQSMDKGSADKMNFCSDWSKRYMTPRVITRNIIKEVPTGVKVEYRPYTRDARVRWCHDTAGQDLDTCVKFAFRMEAGPQVQVRYVHDSYQDLFNRCNDEGKISVSDPNHIQLRNDRIRTCGELALRASHDH